MTEPSSVLARRRRAKFERCLCLTPPLVYHCGTYKDSRIRPHLICWCIHDDGDDDDADDDDDVDVDEDVDW